MALNRTCPKCGGNHVQMSDEKSKHGCLWTLLFGVYYLIVLIFKWVIGFFILVFYDSWMSIVKKCQKKGYVWQSKKWFSGKKRVFYCHDCGYNFKA